MFGIFAFELAPCEMHFYVRDMKRLALLLLCSALLRISTLAADNAAADPADVEEMKRLVGKVQDLEEASAVYRRDIADLKDQNERLRSALREANDHSTRKMADFVTREDLKRLAEKLQEVDQKRESDKKLILEEIEKSFSRLANMIPAAGPSNSSNSGSKKERQKEEKEEKAAKKNLTETKNDLFYTHKVEKGESLSDIITAYNTELKKEGKGQVTLEGVRKANPKVNINKIYVGQEILIPVPADKK
jgi:LysM repeat protein